MTKFTIKNLKTLNGDETPAFECSLLANRKVIARVSNTGTGGDNSYNWKNPVVRQEFESQVTDELVWELVEKELPPPEQEEVDFFIAVMKNQIKKEAQLKQLTTAIAQKLGDGWTIYPGWGGTTCVGHPDGYEFDCFIASGVHGADPCHEFCVKMRAPEDARNSHLTEEEKAKWKIPSFDLRTDTPDDIVLVLQQKLEWLNSNLSHFRKRKLKKAETVARIKQSGNELAKRLGLPFKEASRSNYCFIERKLNNGFGECFSIEFEPQSYGDGTGKFSLSACRITDEKILKLIEFCKELDI